MVKQKRELKRHRNKLRSKRNRKRLRYLTVMKNLGRLGEVATIQELTNPKIMKSIGA